MTNKEIAKAFQYLADLLELHEDNPFKVRSYRNAYMTLRKWPDALEDMGAEQLAAVKGVGPAISSKIRELVDTGKLSTAEKYEQKTPPGVLEMLTVPGIGPKKVGALWRDLGAESVGELLYAINENRLIELKGFGTKTQEELRQKLQFYEKSKGQYLYAQLEDAALGLLQNLALENPGAPTSFTGGVRRRDPVLQGIELLMGGVADWEKHFEELSETSIAGEQAWQGVSKDGGIKATIFRCGPQEFGSKLFKYTATAEFLKAFIEYFPGVDFRQLPDEQMVFEKAGIAFIAPELRSDQRNIELAAKNKLPQLISPDDVRGVIHAHSTYSDGINTLREMALACIHNGYAYLVISDHSKAAFYANGLTEQRLREQWDEIDKLNSELAPFRIFKGIECDILADGRLDYDDDTLARFEVVIVSVHSNLRMDREKATARLLAAIEHPSTAILGHPTGRLLLSREGYALDHQRIIEACAANGVAIELNANPYRLDLDWAWIPYAIDRGVRISINPDAHSIAGIGDIKYGVYAARKGGLSAENCLPCLPLPVVSELFQS